VNGFEQSESRVIVGDRDARVGYSEVEDVILCLVYEAGRRMVLFSTEAGLNVGNT
jgi:hypothetical protein